MPSNDRFAKPGLPYGARPRIRQTRRLFLAGAAATLAQAASIGPAAAARPARVLALGDSLTAGYLLGPGEGFAPQLEAALRKAGFDVVVIDAGVSGDTATGGLERLDWALGDGADVAIVELGANDMFRGTDPALVRAALDAILTRLKEKGVRPILAGMKAARGMGADYVAAFDAIYPELAKAHDVPLYPFFLEGVAGDPGLNLSDGIHPTKQGVAKIVAGILPLVEETLRQRAS